MSTAPHPVLAAAFACAAALGAARAAEADPTPDGEAVPEELRESLERFRRLQRIVDLIERESAAPFSPRSGWEGALRGLVGSLGPRARYYSPAECARLGVGAEGRERGFGFDWVYAAERRATVVLRVSDGGPAWTAGLFRGDLLLSLGEASLVDASRERVRSLFASAADDIVLMVRHPDGVEEKLRLCRGTTDGDGTVAARLLPGERRIAYLRLDRLVRGDRPADGGDAAARSATGRSVRRALDGLAELEPEGLILDLRSNGGGDLEAGVEAADCFLSGSAAHPVTIVSTTGRRPERCRTWRARGRTSYPRWPLAVLVDGATAAAAEMVAAALRDNGRALIVGAPTAGDDAVLQTFSLPDGGALRLRVGRWVPPAGWPSVRADRGVHPDLEQRVDPLLRYRLDRRLRIRRAGGDPPAELRDLVDPALRCAREALIAHLVLDRR